MCMWVCKVETAGISGRRFEGANKRRRCGHSGDSWQLWWRRGKLTDKRSAGRSRYSDAFEGGVQAEEEM